jgi:hypothetical protein
MAATNPLALSEQELADIRGSLDSFDMEAPLNETEQKMLGEWVAPQKQAATTAVQEIEEDTFVEEVVPAETQQDYNAQYAYYVKAQALVTLAAFEEGWEAFQEMVLKSFLRKCRRENKEYRGSDPNVAFSYRLKEQAAEDFYSYINVMIAEAKIVPKPVLQQK